MTRLQKFNRMCQQSAQERGSNGLTVRQHINRIVRDYVVTTERVTWQLEELSQGGYLHLFVDGVEREMIGPQEVRL